MSERELIPHETANLFPMMSETNFERLKDDIKLNGQVDPIVVFGNQIIDGRNRYRACRELGIEPAIKDFTGDPEKVTPYILSCNLYRGELTEGQKAVIGAKIKPYYEQRLKVKSNAGDIVARTVNLPTKSIRAVMKIIEQGAPEVISQLEAGKITVADAIAISGLEREKQAKVFELAAEFEQEEVSGIELEIQKVKLDEETKIADKIQSIQDAEDVMLTELEQSLDSEIESVEDDSQKQALMEKREQKVQQTKEKIDKKISVIREKSEESKTAKAHKVFAKIQDLQKKKERVIKKAVKEIKEEGLPPKEFIIYVEWVYKNGELIMDIKCSEVVDQDDEFVAVKGVGGKKVPTFAVVDRVETKDAADEIIMKARELSIDHKNSHDEEYLMLEQSFLAEFKKTVTESLG